MLINASQSEEVRIALVEDTRLVDLDIEQRRNDNKKSNIYNGVISRIEYSLEACFVNYGEGRDGFLPFKDIHPSFVDAQTQDEVKEKLRVGQKLIVQVAREERGNKGAALTTYVSIASTFLVLVPNNPDVEGISRRLTSEERDNLRAKINNIGLRDNEGVIVRTAGTGCTVEELRYDLDILHYIWEQIQRYAKEHQEVGILHHESETIIRVIRDYLTKDVEEIVTDTRDAYQKAQHYLKLVRPKSQPKLTLYEGADGLFSQYKIEDQIDSAFERTVMLKSGGAIVIDTTEALTAIDVNSARYTSGVDIETTAFNTNLEAAEEIARQLKIRDLGGLIVVDFIDMNQSSSQRKIEEVMRQATSDDRARIQLTKISKFGLMEISRQRIRGSIAESINHVCPRCSGTGFIRDNESLSLHIMRQANEIANRSNRLAKLHIMVPNEIASFIMNEKRDQIRKIEKLHDIEVYVIPTANMQTPHFKIHRVRKGDGAAKDSLSYNLPEYYAEQERLVAQRKNKTTQERHVDLSHSTSSVPDEHVDKTFEARLEKAPFILEAQEQKEVKESWFGKFKSWLKDIFMAKPEEPKPVEEPEVSTRAKSRRKSRASRRKLQAAAEILTPDNTKARDFKEAISNKDTKDSTKAERQEKRDLVRKKVDSGTAVEEVYTSEAKRRRKSKAVDRLNADINPAEVKEEVERFEREQQSERLAQDKASKRAKAKALNLAPEYDHEFEEVKSKRSRRSEATEFEANARLEQKADKAEKLDPKSERNEAKDKSSAESRFDRGDKSSDANLGKAEIKGDNKGDRTDRNERDRDEQAEARRNRKDLDLAFPLTESSKFKDEPKAERKAKSKADDGAEVRSRSESAERTEAKERGERLESHESKTRESRSDITPPEPKQRKRNQVRQATVYLTPADFPVDVQVWDNWNNSEATDKSRKSIPNPKVDELPQLMTIVNKDGIEIPLNDKAAVKTKQPRKGTINIGRLDKPGFISTQNVQIPTLAPEKSAELAVDLEEVVVDEVTASTLPENLEVLTGETSVNPETTTTQEVQEAKVAKQVETTKQAETAKVAKDLAKDSSKDSSSKAVKVASKEANREVYKEAHDLTPVPSEASQALATTVSTVKDEQVTEVNNAFSVRPMVRFSQ